MIDELWELHNRLIPDYDGKIFISLTGGLDSRVLAGIISKRRKIDLGYYYYHDETKYNIPQVIRMRDLLNYKNFVFIKGPGHGITKQKIHPLEEVKKVYNLKEYTYIVNGFGDIATGMSKTLKRNRQFYMQKGFFVPGGFYAQDFMTLKYFKTAHNPLWTPEFIGYLHSMPKYMRLFQYAYIQMIKKYLPKLYEVPRCYENGSGNPTKLDWYPIRRLIDKVTK